MRNKVSISVIRKDKVIETMVIMLLLVCTFFNEIFSDKLVSNNIMFTERHFVRKNITDPIDDIFVFDAFISFSEERYDGDLESYSKQPTFSVLNPRLYQKSDSNLLDYRSLYLIDQP